MFGRRQQRDWELRLEKEVQKLRSASTYREVTLNRLKELVDAPSEQALSDAIFGLVSDGKLKVVYRVVSPRTRASIATFKSPLDVPETMLDESTGETIDVDRFHDVEAVYVNEAAVAQ